MADLLDLAARCEAAEGPDRRLDVLIGCAVRQMPIKDPGAFLSEWPHPFVPCQFSGSIAAPGDDGDVVCHWEAREFTASIDAAMTLVPEGWTMGNLSQADPVRRETKAYALVAENYVEQGPEPWDEFRKVEEGRAATPALALCAASLRARSAQP